MMKELSADTTSYKRLIDDRLYGATAVMGWARGEYVAGLEGMTPHPEKTFIRDYDRFDQDPVLLGHIDTGPGVMKWGKREVKVSTGIYFVDLYMATIHHKGVARALDSLLKMIRFYNRVNRGVYTNRKLLLELLTYRGHGPNPLDNDNTVYYREYSPNPRVIPRDNEDAVYIGMMHLHGFIPTYHIQASDQYITLREFLKIIGD